MKDEYAKWTYYGASALVSYYEEMEEQNGEEIDFDTVAIRCDWSEYKTLEEIAEAYSIEGLQNTADEKEREKTIVQWVESEGELIVLEDNKGFLARLI